MADLEFVESIVGAFIIGESVPEGKEEGNSWERLFEFSFFAVNIGLQGNLFFVFIDDNIDSFWRFKAKDGIEDLNSQFFGFFVEVDLFGDVKAKFVGT